MSIFERIGLYNSRKTEKEAEETYQIKEYGGELWLTFNGSLVCPCSMLNKEPVEAIKQMRELYVKRNER
jgi:hypothetical protein